mgnify:CR=1 FL=1
MKPVIAADREGSIGVSGKFLLCVGCQKGGTTWLSEYLRSFAEVRLGPRKEMHVLDVHFLESNSDWHTSRIEANEATLARLEARGTAERELTPLRRKLEGYRAAQPLTANLEDYASYFRRLADEPGVLAVADLTPDYAALRPEHWAIVRPILEDVGFELRVLFLMRDPLERIESVWRMWARDSVREVSRGSGVIGKAAYRGLALARHIAAKVAPAPADDRFLSFALDPENLDRSRYERTIESLDASFPAEAVWFGFYETLFAEETIRDILDFAGLPWRAPDFDKRVNASPLETPIAAKDRARVRETLEPTYRYCADRFGEDRLRAIWKNF